MCCQLTVSAVSIEIAMALLEIGQFEPTSNRPNDDAGHYLYWRRELGKDEAGTMMAVKANIERNQDGTGLLRLYIEPSITHYDQHAGRRIQASTALEIAARVAEKVGAEIQQLASVLGCSDDGVRAHVLASYPLVPLQYSALCPGFQQEFLNV
jgi:hypothetical protein